MTAHRDDPCAETRSDSHAAVFVASENALSAASGGVQSFAREMLNVFDAAEIRLLIVKYSTDRRPIARLRRAFRSESYRDKLPTDLDEAVVRAQTRSGAAFIFLFGVELAPLAQTLRKNLPQCVRIILISFGLKSVDLMYRVDWAARHGTRARRVLGELLVDEHLQRQHVDHVFCIAEFEADIERWIGARNVTWLPRVVARSRSLPWAPVAGRIGTVTTLDHKPNHDGLRDFLEAFAPVAGDATRFRLISGSRRAAEALAARFGFIDYLGALTDEQVVSEVASWCCFVHPLFCFAAGSSMKVADALSWGVPIATTHAGVRGYIWDETTSPLASSPSELALLVRQLEGPDRAMQSVRETQRILDASPTAADVAAIVIRAMAATR